MRDIAGAEVHQILDTDPSCAELDGHGDITFLGDSLKRLPQLLSCSTLSANRPE